MHPNCITLMLILTLLHESNIVLCVKSDILRSKSLPQCKACRIYVDSFRKSMEETSKEGFAGGNAAWEEEKLGSYAQSEVRLTQIQDQVCSDVEEGQTQCYMLNGEYEHVIEEWWCNYKDSEPDLFQYLCVNTLKLCCLDFHYGPNCSECLGYPDSVCNNNGRCKGEGTRKGTGQCICHVGYAGDSCDQCAPMFYESYKDDKKQLCSKCHMSCAVECKKAGPSGCLHCMPGWLMDDEKGCVDINECIGLKPVCSHSEFCINSEGSYECQKCDQSCYGCTGNGPDMCISCATGYVLVENICLESTLEERKQHVFTMRYLTYLGLAIATCIILQRNVIIAAIIGMCVAVYITLSEYMLNAPSSIINNIIPHLPKDF